MGSAWSYTSVAQEDAVSVFGSKVAVSGQVVLLRPVLFEKYKAASAASIQSSTLLASSDSPATPRLTVIPISTGTPSFDWQRQLNEANPFRRCSATPKASPAWGSGKLG